MKNQPLKFFLTLLLIAGLELAKAQENVTLITNVQVWDGTSDNVKSVDVLIKDNLIKQVISQ